jgi:hypothetical protein
VSDECGMIWSLAAMACFEVTYGTSIDVEGLREITKNFQSGYRISRETSEPGTSRMLNRSAVHSSLRLRFIVFAWALNHPCCKYMLIGPLVTKVQRVLRLRME